VEKTFTLDYLPRFAKLGIDAASLAPHPGVR
jgi:hypothetical protein